MKTEQKVPEYVRPEIEVIALRESAVIMTSVRDLNGEDDFIFEQQ